MHNEHHCSSIVFYPQITVFQLNIYNKSQALVPHIDPCKMVFGQLLMLSNLDIAEIFNMSIYIMFKLAEEPPVSSTTTRTPSTTTTRSTTSTTPGMQEIS